MFSYGAENLSLLCLCQIFLFSEAAISLVSTRSQALSPFPPSSAVLFNEKGGKEESDWDRGSVKLVACERINI